MVRSDTGVLIESIVELIVLVVGLLCITKGLFVGSTTIWAIGMTMLALLAGKVCLEVRR